MTWTKLDAFALGTSRRGVTAIVYSPDQGGRFICDVDRKDGDDERTEHPSLLEAIAHAQGRLDALADAGVQT